jgi:GNAT superfamily N-acetyltransferase
MAAVEAWAAERGATAVRGPMNPSTNYECGLLVEGFGRPPVIMMTYNPVFYPRLIEGAGYRKVKDLLAYISPVHGASLRRLQRLAERTRSRNPGLVTRGANLDDFEGEVRLVQDIYNRAWERNWGFIPMSDREIAWMAKELKPLAQTDLLRFAFLDGEPVAFLLTLPDWNPVLADLDGSPWRHPIRTARHLLRSKPETMTGLRLITLGVTAEHRKRGIEGVLLGEGLQSSLEIGYQWCEYSWILEDNDLTKRAVRLMDGERYKTYRVYEKGITGTG